jgi:dephospho-CoA kinase
VIKVALTGGIGSGKSAAGDFFEDLGAVVVDADLLARDVIERGTDGFDELVAEAFEVIVQESPKDSVIVYQIPILVETKGQDRFDYVITVEASLENRISRLKNRGLKGYEIEARMRVQATDEQRAEIADSVLKNDGDLDSLLRQVENIYEDVLLPRAKANVS